MVIARPDTKQSYADKLLDILSRPGLPNVLTTAWIGQQMHTPWRNVSKHVMIIEDVQRAIANLGWRYVSRKGRLGSTFERSEAIATSVATLQRKDEALTSRMEGITGSADTEDLGLWAPTLTSIEMCPAAEALGI